MSRHPSLRTYLNRCITYVVRALTTTHVKRGLFIVAIVLLELFALIKLHDIFVKKVFLSTSNCNIGLFISAVILGFLAIIDDFSNYIRLVFWKSTLIKVTLIVFACYLAYDCSQIKDTLNDKLLTRQKGISDSLQNLRDQAFKTSLNDSLKTRTKEITSNFITALAENGKEYVAAQKKVIDVVRDSAKKQTVIQKLSPPELSLDTIKLSDHANGIKRFSIFFVNAKDEAIKVKINLYIIGLGSDGLFKRLFNPQTIYIDQLGDRKSYTDMLDFSPSYFIFKTYYIYLAGGYYDKYNKYYSFNNFSVINGVSYKMNYPQGDNREGLLGIFRKYFPEIKFE